MSAITDRSKLSCVYLIYHQSKQILLNECIVIIRKSAVFPYVGCDTLLFRITYFKNINISTLIYKFLGWSRCPFSDASSGLPVLFSPISSINSISSGEPVNEVISAGNIRKTIVTLHPYKFYIQRSRPPFLSVILK